METIGRKIASVFSVLCLIHVGCIQHGHSQEEKTSIPPLLKFSVINAHEHIESASSAARYLDSAKKYGINKTVLLGSYQGIYDKARGSKAKLPYYKTSDNNEVVLELAKQFRSHFIPFVLIRPTEKNKLNKFETFLRQGARGLHIRGADRKN